MRYIKKFSLGLLFSCLIGSCAVKPSVVPADDPAYFHVVCFGHHKCLTNAEFY